MIAKSIEERINLISLAFFNKDRESQAICRHEITEAILQERERLLASMETLFQAFTGFERGMISNVGVLFSALGQPLPSRSAAGHIAGTTAPDQSSGK